jgi:ribosomal subunit interface protein
MQVIIRSRNVAVSKALQDHTHARIQRAFEPFVGHIARVEVVFSEPNGARNGLPRVCRVFIERSGGGWLMFACSADDHYLAATRAAAGAGRHLARELARSRTYTRLRRASLDAA